MVKDDNHVHIWNINEYTHEAGSTRVLRLYCTLRHAIETMASLAEGLNILTEKGVDCFSYGKDAFANENRPRYRVGKISLEGINQAEFFNVDRDAWWYLVHVSEAGYVLNSTAFDD